MSTAMPISFSYGLASREADENLSQLLKRADESMYAHKASRKIKQVPQ